MVASQRSTRSILKPAAWRLRTAHRRLDSDFQRGEDTTVIDLNGRRMIPGLNDSHLHVIRGGLNYNMELRWDGVPSLADGLRMLREQARRTPPASGCGSWVDGASFSLPSGECRH